MKDNKNKKAFTCLVKHFRSNPLMAMLHSRQSRFSQTKFRSIAAHSYGFTLAETLIVLVVLGIVTMITIPNVVRRYYETQARTKIKKTMAIYDYTIQKVALENDLKSERALKQWANNDGQCTNSRKLFDIAEGEGCTFMTKDKIYLNISDITHIVVSLKKFEPAGVKLAKRKADDNMDETTFYFVTTYDPKIGSFRTNDLGYEKSLDENSDDTKRVENLIAFMTGKEPEVDVCKTDSSKALVYDGEWTTVEETYDSKGKVTSRKTTNPGGSYNEEFFDSNGNPTSKKYYYNNGNPTGETKYEYDSNGNQTSEKYYDSNGNLTSEYRYTYDGNGNRTSQKYYNSNGNNYEYRYEYDGNGNQTSMKNYDSNGNLTSEQRYEYDGNGNQTSAKYYDDNGNLSSEQRYEYDGNGNKTSQKYNDSNGNLTSEYRYTYDGNGNRTSYKSYNSSGNLIDERRYEYDGNGNQTSTKNYDSNGNLIIEYTKSYEYDSCGRIIKYRDSSGANYSL